MTVRKSRHLTARYDMAIKEIGLCALCEGPYEHYGNNPQPALPRQEQRVCDMCNATIVIPLRLLLWRAVHKEAEQ